MKSSFSREGHVSGLPAGNLCPGFLKFFFFLWLMTGMVASPALAQHYIQHLTSVNKFLFFSAYDPDHGTELWKSDGMSGGTRLVKDILPGGKGAEPKNLTNVDGTLFFAANSTDYSFELWKSDGTDAGTVKVKDIPLAKVPDNTHRVGLAFAAVGQRLFFTGNNGGGTYELWISDGTPQGTVSLLQVDACYRGASYDHNALTYYHEYETPAFIQANGAVYFSAGSSSTTGCELWKSDGSLTGTKLIKDILPGAGSSAPDNLLSAHGLLYFSADDGTHGRELWKTDGTAEGTYLVKDLLAGKSGSNPRNLTFVGGTLYFSARQQEAARERELEGIWKTDGTEAGTVIVENFSVRGAFEGQVSTMVAVENRLFFNAFLQIVTDGVYGTDIALWRMDEAGTGAVWLHPFGNDIYPTGTTSLTNNQGLLFFAASSRRYFDEIWKSDGTLEGTQMVKSLKLSPGSEISSFVSHQGTMYFLFKDPDAEEVPELWRTAGTVDCAVPVQSFFPTSLCVAKGSITYEIWPDVPGKAVSAIPVATLPASTSFLDHFGGPSNVADSFGSRIRGYVYAPRTGEYTFWIAGANNCELWLSSDDSPEKKRRIAFLYGFSAPQEWSKHPSQKSKPIRLEAGRKYYIEALHKADSGDDHVAIAWLLPNGVLEAPIPGIRLGTFMPKENISPWVQLLGPAEEEVFFEGQQIPLAAKAADLYGKIERVEFFSGEAKLGELTAPPFTFVWRNALPGSHLLTARATDNDGATSLSQEVRVTVTGPHRIFTLRDQTYGGNEEEALATIISTDGNGLLFGGSSRSGKSGDKSGANRGGLDYWILKTDHAGIRQWDFTYGGPGDETLSTVIRTSDGGYLLAGTSSSGAGGDKSGESRGASDFWVVKISRIGAKQWDRTFGGTNEDELNAVLQTPDGGYLLAGTSYSGKGGDKSEPGWGNSDFWVVKISPTGTKQWDRTFGGTSWDNLQEVLPTPDGGYLLAGTSYSEAGGDKTGTNQGISDYWVVKISRDGNQVWDQTYGGAGQDGLKTAIRTADGSFLLAGTSSSGMSGDRTGALQGGVDYWVVKIGADGTKIWDRAFGGSGSDYFTAALGTPDGGFLLGGYSNSPSSGDKTLASYDNYDFWVLKTNPEGNKEWDHTLGGQGYDELNTLLLSKEGDFVLGGTSNSGIGKDKASANRGDYDFWTVWLKVSKGGETVAPNSASGAIQDRSPVLPRR
jgi:ELWxxDGT repeat protein